MQIQIQSIDSKVKLDDLKNLNIGASSKKIPIQIKQGRITIRKKVAMIALVAVFAVRPFHIPNQHKVKESGTKKTITTMENHKISLSRRWLKCLAIRSSAMFKKTMVIPGPANWRCKA